MFKPGDTVLLIPNCNPKADPPQYETAIVTDPHEPTTMRRIDGTPVGHYVRTTRGGYHSTSLTTKTAQEYFG